MSTASAPRPLVIHIGKIAITAPSRRDAQILADALPEALRTALARAARGGHGPDPLWRARPVDQAAARVMAALDDELRARGFPGLGEDRT